MDFEELGCEEDEEPEEKSARESIKDDAFCMLTLSILAVLLGPIKSSLLRNTRFLRPLCGHATGPYSDRVQLRNDHGGQSKRQRKWLIA